MTAVPHRIDDGPASKNAEMELLGSPTGIEVPRLDDQLCFLFYATSRAFINAYRLALEQLDLTYPQYLVMLVLWEKDDLTVGQIGERLFLDSGTLTPMLQRLTAKGLTVRQRDSNDERLVRVTLTKGGNELRRAASSVADSLRCKVIMPERKARLLQREMRSLIGALQS